MNTRLSRRDLLKIGAAGIVAGLTLKPEDVFAQAGPPPSTDPEFIVVGSGAGGGPLACNLALAGHKVVLIEAGGDEADDVAAVPAFHPFASEDPRISWAFFVRHYESDALQSRDPKFVETFPFGLGNENVNVNGVYYPRVGALGGCTIHSALVEMYPSNSDWEVIVDATDDESFNPVNMRRYYERFEQCRYAPILRGNPARHGFHGWQPAEFINPQIYTAANNNGDPKLERILQSEVATLGLPANTLGRFFSQQLDVNDWRVLENREGLFNAPLTMRNGRRVGIRERIRQVAALPNSNLTLQLNSLVTRVLFEGTTAVGVEYLESLPNPAPNSIPVARIPIYRAARLASPTGPEPAGARKELRATREVILAGGTFNSPQILKLSGIGPATELSAHNIPVVVDRQGVGENLQDRYEVVVITRFNSNFQFGIECNPAVLLDQDPNNNDQDPCIVEWLAGQGGLPSPPFPSPGVPTVGGLGPYASGGQLNFVLKKSNTGLSNDRRDPDIALLGGPVRIIGYEPGYSSALVAIKDQYTWGVLAAHTVNSAGTVKLRSADPRDTPLITFHYFDEGDDTAEEDLNAVADGVELVRQMNEHLVDITATTDAEGNPIVNGELVPGAAVDTREEIKQFIKDNAWGHHASCSNKMGRASELDAVVDSNFRVIGTQNLRIVDASVFPRIPGYFVIVPIYMISEKASDVILADHGAARDVTHQVSVTRGGFRFNRTTGRYVQTLTLTNTGGTPISGPVSLVVDGLLGGTLFGAAGVTSALAPLGNPFVNVNVGGDNVFSAGESATVVLEFTNPTNAPIDYLYGTRVLAGTGTR